MRRSRPRGFTLAEVLVALSLAVLFLCVSSTLEVTSIHFLEQLQCREQATLIAQETLNQLSGGAQFKEFPQASKTVVTRNGFPYNVTVEVTKPAPADRVTVTNCTIPVADLEARTVLVTVTVHWIDPRSPLHLHLSRSLLWARENYDSGKAAGNTTS